MGFLKRLKQKVVSWFKPKQTNNASAKANLPTIKRVNRGSTFTSSASSASSDRRQLLDNIRGRERTLNTRTPIQTTSALKENPYKAKKFTRFQTSSELAKPKIDTLRTRLDSATPKRAAYDPKEIARQSARARLEARRKKMDEELEKRRKERRESTQKYLDKRKQEREAFHKSTGHKYDAEYGSKEQRARARQRIKSGDYQSDPDVMKHEVKYHPIAASASRGALSGTTFGLSDLAARKLTKGKAREAEEYYQKHKNKKAEIAGEVVGSLASFGATAGATEKLGAKAVGKVAPRAAEKLAEKELIKKAATKSVEKAVKKGLVKESTEELIKEVGKKKAQKIVNAVGGDVVQNLTTGAIYDLANASKEHEVGSDDWWKEMGKSAAINFGITGGIAGASALKGSKRLAAETADELGRKYLKETTKNTVAKNADNIKGVVEFPPKNNSTIDVINPDLERRGKTVEFGQADEGIEVINPNVKKTAKAPEVRQQEVRPQVEEPNVKSIDATTSKPKEKQLNLTEETKPKQVNLNEAVGNDERMTFDDAVRIKNERRAAKDGGEAIVEETKKPKTKKQIKAEKKEEEKFFKSIDGKLRETASESDAMMREKTGGDKGVRQGLHTAASVAPKEDAERIAKEADKVNDALKSGEVSELFKDDTSPFGVFKTANKEERRKIADSAVARVNENVKERANRLLDLSERLKKDLADKSALASGEHVSLDDIAEIVAIRNKAIENGVSLPAKYEEAFSNIIMWQRTESAQMLKATDLFLKENSQQYRRMLLARDTERYLRKILNADNKAIADIKRSLDANHYDGYFDDMLDTLSEFKGDKSEDTFRKAYADFQAEIFMNTKPTVWDTINLWRHTLMLSSPKTGANNIIGNVLQRTMYRISDAMNLVGESIAQGINKDVKRTTALLKTSDQRRLARMYTSGKRGERNIKNAKYLSGFTDQEFADAINRVSDTDVGDMMASSKYMGEVVKGLKYKPTTVGGKMKQGVNNLGGAISNKYVSTMLNEPDSWFVERNYRSALLKYLEANGVNSAETLNANAGLLKEARAYAKDVALENTYKKANNVVSFLEGIRNKGHAKGSNLAYKTGAIILDAEVPYLKVPANLIVNNFKYSPMGVFNVAADAYKYIVKGDVEALNKATRDLSKSLTGTGMAALGYMMFCKDQADDDSWGFIGNAKDELKEYGVRDNSFKIGNKNFSIANMGIGSVQFLMGAALAEDLAEQGATPPHQVAIDALGKTVDTVADMSLMENAVSLLDAFGNGGDYNATVSDRFGNAATEIAGDYAAQFIANPLRGLAKGMTDADLDTGVKKGDTTKVQRVLERNKNNFIQGVPVINEKLLPHKVDTHGNLVGERKTNKDKAVAVANNLLNPLSPKTVNISEADKEELKVKKENGEPFKPQGFDSKREYKAKVGAGQMAEHIDLTAKEREQVARAAKQSGYDGAMNLIKKGMFGDRLGDRAQEILNKIPEDEEKAREMIFSTPEWKNASNEQKEKWLEAWYGQGVGNSGKGVARTRNAEAYINVAGKSEGDFRFQNDLHWSYQKKYVDNGLADVGIDKGTWANLIQSIYDANHKWDEEKGNVDTPNSAWKVKQGILNVEGLTPEQRVAAYQTIRGKRNGFGWYDWDGESLGSGYRRYGRRRRYRRRRYGGSKAKAAKPVPIKASDYKADKPTLTKVQDHVFSAKVKSLKSSGTSGTAGSGSSKASNPIKGVSSKKSTKSLAETLKTADNATTKRAISKVEFRTAEAMKASAKKRKKKKAAPKSGITVAKIEPPKVKFKKYEV